MVEERTTDGKRIAQLLASEADGRSDGGLGSLSVENADRDAEPSVDGTLAYEIHRDGEPFADVYIHEDRARVEVRAAPSTVAEAAEREGLRVRPKAVEPPRTLVFVESGAEVKRAARALAG